jgi:hypothetical protein
MKWFGIDVKNEITVNNIKLLMGDNEFILLYTPDTEKKDHENFFHFLKYILTNKTGKIHSSYGIFYSNFYEMIRKKIKPEILVDFNEEKFIFLLDGINIDAYYENSRESEGFWGVEIRYVDTINLKD